MSHTTRQFILPPILSFRDFIVAAAKALLRAKSLLQALVPSWLSLPSVRRRALLTDTALEFLRESEEAFLGPLRSSGGLAKLCATLKAQFREGLRSSPEAMLPSYNSKLPSGLEKGQHLALDVGGSTLRVALVELGGDSKHQIVRMNSWKIDNEVRKLRGREFFDWIAERVRRVVGDESELGSSAENPLLVGLSWSFPIDQTSSSSGKILPMGKGFCADEGLVGADLGEVIQSACLQQSLHISLAAIVNDSSATLLSEAYSTPATRFGLILGTGVNVAAHLPVTLIGREKYGIRPRSWHESATHVVVNTEIGMFGREEGSLPLTKWDRQLKAAHPRPDFQPYEQLVGGYYLGEICRLALIDAIESVGVFGGTVPESLRKEYGLDTETLSIVEADTSPSLDKALKVFTSRHPSPVTPTVADLKFLQTLSSQIARRGARLVAAGVVALRELKIEAEKEMLTLTSGDEQPVQGLEDVPLPKEAAKAAAQRELELLEKEKLTVAWNGSVIEKYTGFRGYLEEALDELVQGTGVELVQAEESSLVGAAVALVCLE
ncbi:hexokinase-like protein [Thermochaetoides thermophila DSM 1495]|uniref:Phosphotransferase n=1 Tax=Chaetomium thermophilum (strain DSM 1495 / CBS 144.50 / IMI 039719) TaxID=759272 RepID=G0SA67_CHATD|nr:hexokinase-like protein [Thermochaetoides thermophila DSM 1495]EGS19639.1 hexokinase-like protein [Thermochaetoides thermophila DSM 1495]